MVQAISMYGFPPSTAPLRKVDHIQFGILSPEETKAMSVAKIEFPEHRENDRVKPGGLLDPRMGTVDRNFKCQTCGENMTDCPGHFGHIELAKPVYHGSFLKKIKKVLECVCINCGKLLVDNSNDRFKRAQRIKDRNRKFQEVWEIAKAKNICEAGSDPAEEEMGEKAPGAKSKANHGGCGARQPSYRLDALKIKMTHKASKDEDGEPTEASTKDLTAEHCRKVFESISDEDCELMGLSSDWARHEWMIFTVLPVPPSPVRPSISSPGAPSAEDDLTFALQSIVKSNISLKNHETEGSPAHIIAEFEALLQYHVATLMNNDLAGLPQSTQRRSGRPLKSIRARLKGKEGRLRGNLMGKRVDFSARTVITGDPNLNIDQVGVPRSIARNLTFPETVTPFNIERLQQYVANGPTEHPGAKFVIRDNGERIDLRYSKSGGDIHLQYGYKVERHLIDNDLIIFNRQPSLHKMSMMGHRVKVMPYSTFRLNLSVTTPYNADFDGDEMNMHVPQSYETRAEVQELCMVPKQIVSPQKNGPCMGIVQDTLCGIRKFTKRDNFLTKDIVMNILMWVPDWDGVIPTPAILKPVPLWTGKQMMSLIIPKINLEGFHSQHPDDEKNPDCSLGDTKVIVMEGELIAGILCKKTVGNSAGGIIHVTAIEHGPEVAKQFFHATQVVVNYWLLQNGFSIGIGDTIADDKVMESIASSIRTAKDAVKEIVEQAQNNTLKPEPGMTIRATFESKVTVELNKARDNSGKLAEKSLSEHNNARQMVIAGSKGSSINISQMAACVGQQSVEGKRIPFGFKNRSLPHFTKDDHSPDARGFVENSYLRGLTPQEFFFHAMGGREGLIDTAVKTAETGYIQRRLVKALEDVMAKYDSTVRNSAGEIVQFLYGEDGMDGGKVEGQVIESMKMDDKEFERKYRVDIINPEFKLNSVDNKVINDLMNNPLSQSRLDEEWPLPVNLKRLITNACRTFNVDRRKLVDLSPIEVYEGVQNLIPNLAVVRGHDALSLSAQEDATLLFQILVRNTLASRRVLEEYRLNSQAFLWVLGEIQTRFDQAIVHPGEMVGTIAAQSIGEPATQMTLNTFHKAGVGNKAVTSGVPRLKERLTKFTEIWYDPDPQQPIPKNPEQPDENEDAAIMELFALEDDDYSKYSPWVLRIGLNFDVKRNTGGEKGVPMEQICGKIMDDFAGDLKCWFSDDNTFNPLILARIKKEKDEMDAQLEEDVFLKRLENNILNDISICGVPGISKAFISEHKYQAINAAGKYNMEKDHFLETEGTNLKMVMTLKGVDPAKTTSNSIVEVIEVLGIEAARAALLHELRSVINSEGSYVNYRHLALLSDIMCQRGYLMAITRHGINRTDAGVLARCSFEETVELLMDAAGSGELDDCRGVSESIILGQLAPIGTGSFEVLLNEDMLQQAHELQDFSTASYAMDTGYAPTSPAHTPYVDRVGSPTGSYSPIRNVIFSPSHTDGKWSPIGAGGSRTPGYGPASPGFGATSPSYSPTS
ncbi:DNA-directed RNA polymerase II subunit rpb1, partial [Blyttiomyces sp. JEL0837]